MIPADRSRRGRGRVWAELRQQTVTTVAPSSTTAQAFDADDVQGKLAERMRADAPFLNRTPG
jgi:hypothetical protein